MRVSRNPPVAPMRNPDLYPGLRMLGILLALLLIVAALRACGPSGEGAGAASGYDVGGIRYTLLGSDPSRIDGIDFELATRQSSGIPRQVAVSLDDGGHWTACVHASGSHWTSPLRAAVRELKSLRVVAAQ